jgi:hypothetical protein
LEEANRILRGTLAKAQELNIKISGQSHCSAWTRCGRALMWPKARPSSRRHSGAGSDGFKRLSAGAKWIRTCSTAARFVDGGGLISYRTNDS